jgi:hypothetical protein
MLLITIASNNPGMVIHISGMRGTQNRRAGLFQKFFQLLRRHLEHGTSSTNIVQGLTQAEQFSSDLRHVGTIPQSFDRGLVKIAEDDLDWGHRVKRAGTASEYVPVPLDKE